MKKPVEGLASAHDAASFLARLALQTPLPASVLEEVRALLHQYPPRRIARALEEAISLSVVEGRTPAWPPADDTQALQTLVLGLLDLADETLPISIPHPIAA